MSGPFKSTDELLDFLEELFETDKTGDPGGDRLPLSAHMLQTAATAAKSNADDALVAASLLHDVGHWLIRISAEKEGGDGDLGHESVGAEFLQPHFGPRVTIPILHHVSAKRYLCARDPKYFSLLSPGSVRSLESQGGPMSSEEAERFEALPDHDRAVVLRRWDEYGKVPGLEVPDFRHYRPLLTQLLRKPDSR